MRKITLVRSALLVALATAVACGVSQQTTPNLAGPSEFALSVSVTALPDTINQDGGSQSSVQVVAHDANGQPKSGQSFRLDILVNGAQVDFGTLSARTIVTGSDGTAFAIYTAPPLAPSGSIVATCRTFNTPGALAGQCVTITATPTGSNFSTSQTQSAEIRLVPPGVILPPGQTPVASFVVSPTPVNLNVPALFDASASCAGPLVNGACNAASGPTVTISQYAWAFGDGATASGKTASHTYTTAGSFSATLTVTNSGGLAASATQQVVVAASAAPTGTWVFSPTTPSVGDSVSFNADGVHAAAGHTIVQSSWDFGDGAGASGTFATHTYAAANTYAVSLTVRDDADQKTTITQSVAVGTGAPLASFTFANTATPHSIATDGSASKPVGTATISTYAWSWGDGQSNAASAASVASHTYSIAGTYTVTLTVKDSLNRVGTTSQSVTVP